MSASTVRNRWIGYAVLGLLVVSLTLTWDASAALAVSPPSVTQNPTNQTVLVNTPVTFTAAATGTPTPTVQWQVGVHNFTTLTWGNIAGATSTSYTFTPTFLDANHEFRAVFTNALGTATTFSALLTIHSLPSASVSAATVQVPLATASETVERGLTATAGGIPSPALQWQSSADGGETWTDEAGGTTDILWRTYGVADDLKQFRIVATNIHGSATSSPVTVRVGVAPVFTFRPSNVNAAQGSQVTFLSAATSPTPMTVQWSSSPVVLPSQFTPIAGADQPTLTLTAGASNQKFSVAYANAYATIKAEASLTLLGSVVPGGQAPYVTLHPVDQTVPEGAGVTFSAAASGTPTPSVQWQRSPNGSASWADIPGATGTSYSLPTVTRTDQNAHFRAVFTNAVGTTTSDAGGLDVTTLPYATAADSTSVWSVANADTTVQVTISAGIGGNPTPTRQWQRSNDGGSSWVDIVGATGAQYVFGARPTDDFARFRVIGTNAQGSAPGPVTTLRVGVRPLVTQHPVAATVTPGNVASFTAAASSPTPQTVLWQRSPTSSGTYTTVAACSGLTTCSFVATLADNGAFFRARFTNDYATNTSSSVKLTVTAGAPNAPTAVTASAGQASATVSWTAPLVDGGSPVTGYVVTPWIGGAAQTPQTFASTATTQTLTGLAVGVPHTFTVAAVNSLGTGVASAPSEEVTPGPRDQTITFDGFPTEASVGTTFAVTATSSSGLTVALVAMGACTVSGSTVTFTTAGSCSVRASQAGDDTWAPAADVVRSATVRRTQTITFSSLPAGLGAGASFTAKATATSGLPVSFVASGACSSVGSTITLIASGTCTVTASQGGNATWWPAPDVVRTTIVRADQTISFDPLPTDPPVGSVVALVATSSSGLTVSFSGSGGCVVASRKVRFTSAGVPCTVTASQPGAGGFLPAPSVEQSVTPIPGSQTISFSALPGGPTVGATFTAKATATSGLAVTFGATGACTADGSTITIVSGGTCTVTASQAGDANWSPAPDVVRTTTVRVAQTISFDPLPEDPPVGTVVNLSATSSSGLTVGFTGSGGCVVASRKVRFTAAGSPCTVIATQTGGAGFLAAVPVVQTVVPVPGPQTIAFGSLPAYPALGSTFMAKATATSGLVVGFEASGACTVSGTTVTIVAAGLCTVTASQAGDADWLPAADVVRTATVKAEQTIDFSPLPEAPQVGSSFTLGATSSSGLTVTYTASGSCTVSGRTLRFVAAGAECTVAARQAGSSTYLAAAPVERTTTPVPGTQTISFRALPSRPAVGSSFDLVASASSRLPVAYAASGSCSIVDVTVTIDAPGRCTVTASQVGDADWLPAADVVRTTDAL